MLTGSEAEVRMAICGVTGGRNQNGCLCTEDAGNSMAVQVKDLETFCIVPFCIERLKNLDTMLETVEKIFSRKKERTLSSFFPYSFQVTNLLVSVNYIQVVSPMLA